MLRGSPRGATRLEVCHLLLQQAQLALQARRLCPQPGRLLNGFIQLPLRCRRVLGGGLGGLLQRVALKLQLQAG